MVNFDIQMDYDCLIGRAGDWDEEALMDLLVDDPMFEFMDHPEPTTKLLDYFFTDAHGHNVNFENLEVQDVFLHGFLSSWDRDVPVMGVGNVKIVEW